MQINIYNGNEERNFLKDHKLEYRLLAYFDDKRDPYQTIEISEEVFAYLLLHDWRKTMFYAFGMHYNEPDRIFDIEVYTMRSKFDKWGFYQI